MVWALQGQNTGLRRDIQDIVLDLLKNNWEEYTPAVNEIVWTDDWYQENSAFCIAVNEAQELPGKQSIGFQSMEEYKSYVDIHMWVNVGEWGSRVNPHLGNMEREVKRIVRNIRIDTIQPGLGPVRITATHQDAEPEGAQTTLWKSHITIEIKYWMGLSPSVGKSAKFIYNVGY